ncbi:MAG: hypothetical protein AB7G05_05265 [Hyphomonadaceae bacterium]
MRTIFVAAAFALAGCGQTANEPVAPLAAPPPSVAQAPNLALEPLHVADTAGRLGGELGCSFRAGDDQVLIASGIVASETPSEALMKLGGVVVEMDATTTGGFDTLEDGEAFAAGGVSAVVATTSAVATGTEEVRHNATLTVSADGGERVYEGVWSCGP